MVATALVVVRFRWDVDVDSDKEDEDTEEEEEDEGALRAAMAVGERRPMPDENRSLEMERAYALGVASL